MNTIDVERRLETLAANSASPDLPLAILDRLAQLEAGVDLEPVQISTVRSIHRASGRNGRRFLLLGVAATLAIAGSLVYAAGNLNKPAPLPTPPVTLGQWHQIHTFTGSDYDQFENVSLSWQNGEIVGVATGHDKFDLGMTCILRSKDGTNWTCSELPKPPDLCSIDTCLESVSVAVSNGSWVATGVANTTDGRAMSLTWTSPDGITWTERTSLRVAIGDSTGYVVAYGYSSFPTDLLATRYGFVRVAAMSAPLPAGANDLMTSTDGTTWQSARVAAGSLPMLGADMAASPNGYLAVGMCATTDVSGTRACAAYSTDGESWTMSYPGAGAPPATADRLWSSGIPVYFGGHWVTHLATSEAASDGTSGFYEADSTDGLHWTITSRPYQNGLQNAFSGDQSQTYYPVYSLPGTSGEWGIGGAGIYRFDPSPTALHFPIVIPTEDPHTYWSQLGADWQQVGDGPVGNPLTIVDTPTQLIAILAVYPDGTGPSIPQTVNPTVSVWAATKH